MQGVINLKGKKAEAEVRTNVMRLLDAAGIHYETGTYEVDENDLSGSHAADLMGIDHDQMYKTLVLKGEKKGYLVCCIPVDDELDLKKVAKAAGEKKEEKKPDEALTLIYQNLEDRMKSVMGTKVSIHNKDKNKGRIEIEYYSEAELERIVEMIESIG